MVTAMLVAGLASGAEANTAWTIRSNGANESQSIAYGAGKFVITGESSTVLTSPDGVNWSDESSVGGEWRSITYGDDQFVAVGTRWESEVEQAAMSSTDGENWTTVETPARCSSVAYGAGQFVAVGSNNDEGVVATSPDGASWTPRMSAAGGWSSVTFADGKFVAVGSESEQVQTMTSIDGITWTANPGPGTYMSAIAYGADRFVALSRDDNGAIAAISTNAAMWTPHQMPQVHARSVTFGDGQFIAIGSGGVLSSTDGVQWTSQSIPTSQGASARSSSPRDSSLPPGIMTS